MTDDDNPPIDTSGLDVVAVGPRSGLRYVHLDTRFAEEIEAIELASFPTALPADLYNADEVRALAAVFPEGCFVALDGDHVAATGLGVRVEFDLDDPQHTVHDVLGPHGNIAGHDPLGPWYYGTNIAVKPDHRRKGIGGELYDLRKGVCRDHNLLGIIAGGVIPGYADHKHHMTADEYVAAVSAGELYDRTLTFQLENGFEAPCALSDYIRDPAVDNYAALIVWHNPDHRPGEPAS